MNFLGSCECRSGKRKSSRTLRRTENKFNRKDRRLIVRRIRKQNEKNIRRQQGIDRGRVYSWQRRVSYTASTYLGQRRELRLDKASGHDRRINTSDAILKNIEDKERKDDINIYMERAI